MEARGAFENLGKAAARALTASLKDSHEWVRVYSASALAQMGIQSNDVQAVLISALDSNDPVSKYQALLAAEDDLRVNPSSMIAKLGKCLEDKSPKVRWEAAAVIGRLGKAGDFAIPALIKNLKDPEPAVRGYAAFALRKIGASRASLFPI